MAEKHSGTSIYSNHDHGLLAKPLHLQRLEHAVRLEPLLNYMQNIFDDNSRNSMTIEDADQVDQLIHEQSVENGDNGSHLDLELDDVASDHFNSKEVKSYDQMNLYNFSKVGKSRKWLKDILLSDSSDSGESSDSVTEEDIQDMLKLHKLKKAVKTEFQSNPDLRQYQYYSTGLLSNYDKFYDHQKLVLGGKKKVKEKNTEKRKAKKKKTEGEKSAKELKEETHQKKREGKIKTEDSVLEGHHSHKSKKKNATSHEAVMNLKRKRLWISICKKEINRASKQHLTSHKEVLTSAKKLAQACQREVRKSALLSQKVSKDVPSRARRLTKEMMLYWKRYDKVEKEHRKKAEKEAQEQLRMDIELREAKRQQRKLNFLITQTELYAHFMSRKIAGFQDLQEQQILNQLDEGKDDVKSSASFPFIGNVDDDYNAEEMKSLAMKNANEAYKVHMSQMTAFDSSLLPEIKSPGADVKEEFDGNLRLSNPSIKAEEEHPQPPLFVGKLKTYQLKGMNWLYSLYDKGINGILADEMGLGKTVQTIAFLATLIKVQGIWGPFLIIAPASTLHNWQQEFTKFVPKLKVLPYWGNTSDRKILRKFWSQKDLHTENASFHVLITSYQLVVQDVKYFQRIKWQYMVLDEAQAIKSTSSVRWKILLGFNCRNRLLLTGTPIQNSMAELWALLHFIMPTLFDSHDEFNEWFSKDIESHAENKTVIDEKHLSRLHKILKPFMLRRVKKDVENELSDKIEILMYCQLTQRQMMLYQSLRNKISIDELMQSSSASSSAQSATSSLLNLVMQFRKVCNHPDLFDRREVKHPFFMKMDTLFLSKIFFREGFCYLNNPSREALLGKMGVFHPEHIHRNLFSESQDKNGTNMCFSFLRFIDVSPFELSQLFLSGLLPCWITAYLVWKAAYRIYLHHFWHSPVSTKYLNRYDLDLTPFHPVFPFWFDSSAFSPLLFADVTDNFIGFSDINIYSSKSSSQYKPQIVELNSTTTVTIKEEQNTAPVKVLKCQPTYCPSFLSEFTPKVLATPFSVYSPDSSAKWWWLRQQLCSSPETLWAVQRGIPIIKPSEINENRLQFHPEPIGGLSAFYPVNGWSGITIPNKETLVTDSGKLTVLDKLLNKLKAEGHRVLIYSQMTRMINLLEEYMWHRKHTYIRLDGSSKISDRRDMVADFQARSDIFVFLLSTRAGGLGINLTAADTVIFYDSDWNPTVDQQAMDRAHRLGQTKQVTVYRLVCKGSIEERILQRAQEKSEIQRMVISGGNFKPDTLKPKEVVSLLLDDDELERKFRLRQEERKQMEKANLERKRKGEPVGETKRGGKRKHKEENITIPATNQDGNDSLHSTDSIPHSPYSEHSVSNLACLQDDNSSDGLLIVDNGSPTSTPIPFNSTMLGKEREGSSSPISLLPQLKKRGSTGRSRGRPRGSGRKPNSRGRGSLLATAAAELAGAQAGKSAAFAAFGYTLNGGKSPGSSSPVQNSSLGRGTRGALRGSSSFTARTLSNRGRGSGFRGGQSPFPTKSISLGFYMPGPQS